VLNIDIPPEQVDVNVHPSKAQVKFADEHALFRSVKAAVTEALAQTRIAADAQHVAFPTGEAQQSRWSVGETEPAVEFTPMPPSFSSSGSPLLPPLRILGQVLTTYIAAEGPDGLYLIDQHAAHERIVYDRLVEQRRQGKSETQGLLEPVTMDFTPTESAILSGLLATLTALGFSLEPFGGHTYLLRAVPSTMELTDVASQVRDIVQDLSQGPRTDLSNRALEAVACHGAVRAGKQLTHEEMRALVRQLEQTSQPRTCPHGRPTVLHFSQVQLEKLFSRRA
jgi:DNA mismatch repair protein MutL